jgi:hypothetical protein
VQVGLDRLQAVVAGQAAPDLDLHPPDRQVELVVHDDQPLELVGRDAEPPHQRPHGQAGVVHVGLGEGERHPAAVDAHLGDEGALLPPLQPLTVTLGQELDDVGAGVVAGAGVLRAGVAEPDDEQLGR